MHKPLLVRLVFYTSLVLFIILQEKTFSIGDLELTMHSFFDQGKYLDSLDSVLNHQSPKWLIYGYHSVGYISLAAWISDIFQIKSALSLIYLNLFSICVTHILVLELINRSLISLESNGLITRISNRHFLLFSWMLTIAFSLGCNFVYFSTIPWSHFVATALSLGTFYVIQYTSFFTGHKLHGFFSVVAGILYGLLINVRLFEGLMVGIGATFAIVISAMTGEGHKISKNKLADFLVFITTLIAITFICYQKVDLKHFHWFYFEVAKRDPVSKALFDINWLAIPYKFYQIFFDTNLYTWSNHTNTSLLSTFLSSDHWSQPLAMQIRGAVFASICFAVTLGITIRKKLLLALFKAQPIFVGMLCAAIGLTILYLSTIMVGSKHLLNGLARDFMLPYWLFGIACMPGILLDKFYSGLFKFQNKQKVILACLIPIVITIACSYAMYLAQKALAIPKTHIVAFETTSSCKNNDCTYSITAKNATGNSIQFPIERVAFGFFCYQHPELLSHKNLSTRPSLLDESVCQYPFYYNCEDLGRYSSEIKSSFSGHLTIPKCENGKIIIHAYPSLVGGGHLPLDQSPPIRIVPNQSYRVEYRQLRGSGQVEISSKIEP